MSGAASRGDRRAFRSRLAGLAVLGVAAVLFASNVVWIARHLDDIRPITTGDVAPPFAVWAVDERGQVGPGRVHLEKLRGKVVIVDFWATWCGPCRQSLPAIEHVYRRHRENGLEVVSINTDDAQKARAMFRAMGMTLPLFVDDGTVMDLYGVSSIPHLVLIDRRGVIRHVHRGFGGESLLDAQVAGLLAR